MRAGFGLILAALYGTPNRTRGVAVVIEDEVGAVAGAIKPAVDAILILPNGCADRLLGGGQVGPGGRSGDIAFAFEALAKLIVSSADMFFQGVAAGGFVLFQIPGGPGTGPGRCVLVLGLGLPLLAAFLATLLSSFRMAGACLG